MGLQADDKDFLKQQFRKLGACLSGSSSTIDTSVLESLIQEILDQLKVQTEEVSPILYCDDNCNITGGIAYMRPENDTSTITPIYFDSNMVITSTAPLGKPCDVGCQPDDYEFKWFEKERCLPDGSKVTEVLCIPYVNDIKGTSTTFWIVNGVDVYTIPVGITDCIEPCYQAIGDFDGGNLPSKTITGFQIIRDNCDLKCKLLVKTSVGDVTVYPGEAIFGKSFKCPITITDIEILEGDCKKEDIKGRWSYTSNTTDRA